jgi:hypothetical protein
MRSEDWKTARAVKQPAELTRDDFKAIGLSLLSRNPLTFHCDLCHTESTFKVHDVSKSYPPSWWLCKSECNKELGEKFFLDRTEEDGGSNAR